MIADHPPGTSENARGVQPRASRDEIDWTLPWQFGVRPLTAASSDPSFYGPLLVQWEPIPRTMALIAIPLFSEHPIQAASG